MSNESSHRQTNKVKILAAIGVHLPRYSNFEVFPVYVMCPQFKISAEAFFFFCDGWIELVKLQKKKYASNFENIFDGSPNFGSNLGLFPLYWKIIVSWTFFVKYVFKIWNSLFLMRLNELYPTITKKEKNIVLKF